MSKLKEILEHKYNKRPDGKRASFIKTLGKSYEPSNPVWNHELRSQYMRQVLRLSISIELYRRRLPTVFQYFERMFVHNRMASGFILTGTFIQQKYQQRTSTRRTNFPLKIATPLQVLFFFHSLVFVSRNVPEASKTSHVGNRVGYVVQVLCSCWDNFMISRLKPSTFTKLFAPYIRFDEEKDLFVPIVTRDEGYSPSTQLKELMHNNVTTSEDDVCPIAFTRSHEEDKSIRALVALFFDHLHECLKDTNVYDQSESSIWERKKMYQTLDNKVPAVFRTLDKDVCKTLNIRHQDEVLSVPDDSSSSDGNTTRTVSLGNPGQAAATSSPAPSAATPLEEDTSEDRPPVSSRVRKRSMPKRVRFSIPVKEEDEEVVVIEDEEDEPPSKKRRVQGISPAEKNKLRDFMDKSSYCYLFNDSFENFNDCVHESTWTHSASGGRKSLKGRVHLILTDPPYNVRRESTRQNAEYDSLSLEDMRKTTYLFAELLCPGGHGIVFCSMTQFSQWYDLLSKYRRNQQSYDEEEALKRSEGNRGASSDSAPNNVKLGGLIFQVDPAGLHMVRAKGKYNSNPFWKNKLHANGVEHAIHFQKKFKKGTTDGVIRKPTSTHSLYVKSSHPPYVNVIDNVQFAPREILYKPVKPGENPGPGRRPMLRPEQKSVNLMKHFITEYTKPGSIVVDLFGGTFSTARACMSLREPRIFFGCEKDPNCFIQAEEHVMDAFYKSSQGARNPMQLDTTPVQLEVDSFLKYMEDKRVAHRIVGKSADAPKGLPEYQMFPPHIIEFVSSTMRSNFFYDNCSRLRFDQWPESGQHALEALGSNSLRAAEAVKYQLRICPSNIKHERAGVGVFTNRKLFKDNQIACFYGRLIYGEMENRTYGTGIMAVNPKQYYKYAMEVQGNVKDSDGQTHKVHVIPAPFCVAGFINDAKYNEGDLEYNKRYTPSGRKPNVKIVRNLGGKNTIARSRLQECDLLAVVCMTDIKAGDELYVSYGEEYDWGTALNRAI